MGGIVQAGGALAKGMATWAVDMFNGMFLTADGTLTALAEWSIVGITISLIVGIAAGFLRHKARG